MCYITVCIFRRHIVCIQAYEQNVTVKPGSSYEKFRKREILCLFCFLCLITLTSEGIPDTYSIRNFFIRFAILTAVTKKIIAFSVVMSCRMQTARRFGRTYRLHLQGRVSQVRIWLCLGYCQLLLVYCLV